MDSRYDFCLPVCLLLLLLTASSYRSPIHGFLRIHGQGNLERAQAPQEYKDK
jgi:hypothetical protein